MIPNVKMELDYAQQHKCKQDMQTRKVETETQHTLNVRVQVGRNPIWLSPLIQTAVNVYQAFVKQLPCQSAADFGSISGLQALNESNLDALKINHLNNKKNLETKTKQTILRLKTNFNRQLRQTELAMHAYNRGSLQHYGKQLVQLERQYASVDKATEKAQTLKDHIQSVKLKLAELKLAKNIHNRSQRRQLQAAKIWVAKKIQQVEQITEKKLQQYKREHTLRANLQNVKFHKQLSILTKSITDYYLNQNAKQCRQFTNELARLVSQAVLGSSLQSDALRNYKMAQQESICIVNMLTCMSKLELINEVDVQYLMPLRELLCLPEVKSFSSNTEDYEARLEQMRVNGDQAGLILKQAELQLLQLQLKKSMLI